MSDMNVIVLGAGIVGLTTALELQKQIPQANVTIVADKFHRETTSFVAAGIFEPGTTFNAPTKETKKRWVKIAYDYWDGIQKNPEASKAGVTRISGYIFSKTHPDMVRNSYLEDLVPIYRRATETELKLCPGGWKYGSFFTTLLSEGNLFLPWAMENFKRKGGKVVQAQVDSFGTLPVQHDVVVNCSGLGSLYLCNDENLVPLRGQILKVEAPWIKTFFFAEQETYVIPGFEGVTLGGTRQFESFDLDVNKYDGLAIRERCEALVPSLKGAKVVAQRVGLRPYRPVVRVEKEVVSCNGKRVKVVHNYGHGGCGVTMAPATAVASVGLVREIWAGNSKL